MPRNTPRLPQTVRASSSLEQLPLGTEVLVHGERHSFTYRRTAAGWEKPAREMAARVSEVGPLARSLGAQLRTGPSTSEELAATIVRLGNRPATVLSPRI